MKYALLVAGELREFNTAVKFWPYNHFSDLDIYMSTWNVNVYDNPISKECINEVVDESLIQKNINCKKLLVENLPENNTWKTLLYIYKLVSVIELILNDLDQYNVIIITRPDLAYRLYEDYNLEDYIGQTLSHDIVLGITNNALISQKLVSDVLMVMTSYTAKRFYDVLPKITLDQLLQSTEMIDIHSYLGNLLFDNKFEIANLPIKEWSIVRPNSRGKNNLTFDDVCLDARSYWLAKYNQVIETFSNVFNSQKIVKSKHTKNAKINLFDTLDLTVWSEASKTCHWILPDTKAKYLSTKDRLKSYSEDDIVYNYNSLGFRIPQCGYPYEFESCNILPTFMFAGCSFTEGIGLPENHIWHSFLMEKLQSDFDKTLAKINIGKGGRSIDSIVRYIYIVIEKYNAKPDFIYMLLPNITRKELILEDVPRLYNFIPASIAPELDNYSRNYIKNVEKITNLREAYNNAFKNLLFIKYYLMAKNIPWVFSSWNNDFDSEVIKDTIQKIQMSEISLPKEITEHYIGNVFFYRHPSKMYKPIFEQEVARDGLHYGPNSNYYYAEEVFSALKNSKEYKKVIEKWKNL